MKTVIIVQARMTSTRLPGKVLKEVMGKPLLEYQIERLRRVKLADDVIIATTENDTDLPIVEVCNRLGIKYFCGSENDVLARYYGAAVQSKADTIIRATSDCPVIDPAVIDRVIAFYDEHKTEYDYVSNCLKRTYPRGMDTEVFGFSSLEKAYQEAKSTAEREHVTPYIYNNLPQCKLGDIVYPKNESKYRLTVDTIEDFELIKNIIEELYPRKDHFTLEDILDLLTQKPDWFWINHHIEQKKI